MDSQKSRGRKKGVSIPVFDWTYERPSLLSVLPRLRSRWHREDAIRVPSPTPAPFYHHVLVVLEDYFLVLVHIQHGDGRERGGHTASCGRRLAVD
jgi:hypothetical protein